MFISKNFRSWSSVFWRLNNLTKSYSSINEIVRVETGDSSGISTESPGLPTWVTSFEKNKAQDDDFVPPSIMYWIDNHTGREKDGSMKDIVDGIVESDIDKISKILKNRFESPKLVVKALEGCGVDVSDGLIEQVLKRFSCEWIPALGFFKWAELDKGVKHSASVYDLMVDNLGKMKKFNLMWELVGDMNRVGCVTLNTMTKVIRRYAKAGKYDEAVEAFREIELYGIKKDSRALNILMDAFVKQGSVEHAEKMFLEFKSDISPISHTYNILIHGWCKTRQIDKARKTLEEMKVKGFAPDLITYTCFVEAYCREKDFRKVNETFAEMRNNGLRPSTVTYTIVMTALGRAKETNKAIEVYEMMKQENCSIDAPFCNAFINALSKGGRLKDSEHVFEDMSKQGIMADVLTFNSMIKTASENLQEEKALKLLIEMERNGCKPDLNTYMPLLKLCCKLKRMKVLSFLLTHMFKNDVSIDLGTYSLLVTGLCKSEKLEKSCSFFEELVMKGFVPMNCTYEKLVAELGKKGMLNEKQRVEELMLYATKQGFVRSPIGTSEIND